MFVKGLKHLLIHEKETIKAVQTLLNERGVSYIIDIGKHPESYKNHNHDASRIRFSPQDFTKNTISVASSHKEIAKKTFGNLNHIFTKEKHKDPLLRPQETLQQSQHQTESENTVAPLASLNTANTDTDVPIINSSSNLPPNSDTNFEENWRTLMEKKGKAVPIEQIRDKPNVIDDDLLADIWFIDDEINLFDEEGSMNIENLVTMPLTQKKLKSPPYQNTHKILPAPAVTIVPPVVTPQGLTIEQIEKIKHLIAKLDIMRDEMTSANAVINKTLKAFGYSSFENAYDKFDQKSAY